MSLSGPQGQERASFNVCMSVLHGDTMYTPVVGDVNEVISDCGYDLLVSHTVVQEQNSQICCLH